MVHEIKSQVNWVEPNDYRVSSVDWFNPFDKRTLLSSSMYVSSVQLRCAERTKLLTGNSVHFGRRSNAFGSGVSFTPWHPSGIVDFWQRRIQFSGATCYWDHTAGCRHFQGNIRVTYITASTTRYSRAPKPHAVTCYAVRGSVDWFACELFLLGETRFCSENHAFMTHLQDRHLLDVNKFSRNRIGLFTSYTTSSAS